MRKVVSLGIIGMSQQCAQRGGARREAKRKENTEKEKRKRRQRENSPLREGTTRPCHNEDGLHAMST